MWSGRLDLNQRPPAPQAGALPGCATPRELLDDSELELREAGCTCRPPMGQAAPPDPEPLLPEAAAASAEAFSALFSTWLGRKVSTRRAEISISSPVWGFRPTRAFFWRTWKFPKPEILILSPRSSVSFTVSKTSSTISADSFLEKPTFS